MDEWLEGGPTHNRAYLALPDSGTGAGVLVIAFILWGALSTDTLSAVSSGVLAGVITAGGWAFVLSASARAESVPRRGDGLYHHGG